MPSPGEMSSVDRGPCRLMFWTAGIPVVTIGAMKLLDYTTESGFLPHIKCGNVTEAVSQLVASLASEGQVSDPKALVDEIMRREEE